MKKKNKIWSWVMIIVGAIYLLNFTFGIVEFIPDNIPFFGNIDEGVAGGLIWQGIKNLRGKK